MVREKKHMEEYRRWLENSQDNDNLKAHLEKMTSEDVIREAFHKDLEFGTSGLRGVMGGLVCCFALVSATEREFLGIWWEFVSIKRR